MSSRKMVLLEHVSLDGLLAGPHGEMDWIRVDDPALWDDVKALTDAADTAIFGRTTCEMMEAYWPTAGDAPEASQHDIDHSRWLNRSTVIVVSRTLGSARWGASGQAQVVHDPTALRPLKDHPGANLLLIGSASLARVRPPRADRSVPAHRQSRHPGRRHAVVPPAHHQPHPGTGGQPHLRRRRGRTPLHHFLIAAPPSGTPGTDRWEGAHLAPGAAGSTGERCARPEVTLSEVQGLPLAQTQA
jgi:dihydrofolate reductase